MSAEHGHSHGPASYTRAFAIGITLNLAFVAAEAVYGLRANSLALPADAGHNFTDVIGLFLAWAAGMLAKRLPTVLRTYGVRRISILAALANGLLLVIAIVVLVDSVKRIFGAPVIKYSQPLRAATSFGARAIPCDKGNRGTTELILAVLSVPRAHCSACETPVRIGNEAIPSNTARPAGHCIARGRPLRKSLRLRDHLT